jgi:tRNA threonylcarbamoyladenosine biosynthesis protein TsaB
MALILNIDTATENAHISLAKNGVVLAHASNTAIYQQAAWLHVAIKNMLTATNTLLKDINCIAVMAGPGSYTGLRVGMATAKGLCYAKGFLLITTNTLEVMAFATHANISTNEAANPLPYLLCPMIDARRMEVFTALYDQQLNTIIAPTALVLDDTSFESHLQHNKILFFGNGSEKIKKTYSRKNVSFVAYSYTPKDVALYTYNKYLLSQFANLAYAEPYYLKDFYTTKK